ARVGEHYKVRRVPVIKKQAISAYDPRVVEATGISMMATAQGADHTAGNLPRLKTREMDAAAIVEQSLAHQARVAANDSLGLCIFGMSVTNPNTEFLTAAINAAHGTSLTKDFFEALGRDALRLEWEFNKRAGLGARQADLLGRLQDVLPRRRIDRDAGARALLACEPFRVAGNQHGRLGIGRRRRLDVLEEPVDLAAEPVNTRQAGGIDEDREH